MKYMVKKIRRDEQRSPLTVVSIKLVFTLLYTNVSTAAPETNNF